MKVLVKFSDLRKLKNENKFATREIEKLNNCISDMSNCLDAQDKEIDRLKADNKKTKDASEEIKLLTAENNVLLEENNKLKVYAERKQPKFWFGDKVRIKEDIDEEFIIGRMLFKNDIFLFTYIFGDYELYEENELELVDENISK